MHKKTLKRFCLIALCVALMLPTICVPAFADWFFDYNTGVTYPGTTVSPTIRVGIYYASHALPSANLSNEVGSGYQFGYYDSNKQFVSLGSTAHEDITICKDANYTVSGGVFTEGANGVGNLVGAYHLQLPYAYSSFHEAALTAQSYPAGFPAYVDGYYVVRFEFFSTLENAYAAAMHYPNAAVVGGSGSCLTVVDRYSGAILFEFDNSNIYLAIEPISTGSTPQTWFKGNLYYGGFQYARRDIGNISVTNFVNLDDYAAGVIPYELSASWPLEALKSGAVCARSMAMTTSKHTTFDVCNTTCCQLYKGVYTGENASNIYQAAHETAGECAYYNGEYIQAVYCAGTGGFTESAMNTWSTDLPYLRAKVDEFDTVFPYYGDSWSYTVTSAQVTQMLQAIGRNCSTIVSMGVTKRTEVGNVLEVTFVDASGRSFVLSKDDVRCLGNISGVTYMSRCFEIFDASGKTTPSESMGNSGNVGNSGSASAPNGTSYTLFDGAGLSTSQSVYVMTEDGLVEVTGATTCITSAGQQILGSVTTVGGSTAGSTIGGSQVTVGTSIGLVGSGSGWVITGRGNGHNVGLSQCGALAMAKLGYSYVEILKYYFTGIEVY